MAYSYRLDVNNIIVRATFIAQHTGDEINKSKHRPLFAARDACKSSRKFGELCGHLIRASLLFEKFYLEESTYQYVIVLRGIDKDANVYSGDVTLRDDVHSFPSDALFAQLMLLG